MRKLLLSAACMMLLSFNVRADDGKFDDVSNQPTDAFSTQAFKDFLDLAVSGSGPLAGVSLSDAFGAGPFPSNVLPTDDDGDGLDEVATITINPNGDPSTGDDLKQILIFLDNHSGFNVEIDTDKDGTALNEIIIEVRGDGSMPGVPVDGGLSFLALGGIVYGIRHFRKQK